MAFSWCAKFIWYDTVRCSIEVVYQHSQSHIWGGARWSYRKSRDRIDAQPVPAHFSYNSSSTKCIIAHDRHGYRKWRDRSLHDPEGVSLEGCAHVQPKVPQYRPSGAFSPEMTSSNATRRASPGTGSHVTGSALGYIQLFQSVINYDLAFDNLFISETYKIICLWSYIVTRIYILDCTDITCKMHFF